MAKIEPKKNLLVTLADRNYIRQAKQLFSSVYWNAGWKGDYMLLSHDIPEKELKWFRDKGILVKKCKPLSDKGWGSWPPALLDKFYLFTPEFKKWEHVIYLDADIIVRASLDGLEKTKGISAVSHFETIINNFRNMKISSEKDTKRMINSLKEQGYNLKESFFNGGVIVFNTDIIQENTFNNLRKLVGYIDSEERMLNIHFYKKWKKLPLVYNVHVNILRSCNFPVNKIKGIILHFASEYSKDKPWTFENPFHNEWKTNLEKAELIDLNKIPEGKKFDFYKNSSFLQLQYRIAFLMFSINKIMGKIGIFIKKINPGVYYKLKRIKDGK